MKIICKNRCEGKTTELLYASEAAGTLIVVPTEQQVVLLKNEADKLGLKIQQPVSIRTFINKKLGTLHENVYIDEARSVIEDALSAYLGTDVSAITMTPYNSDVFKYTDPYYKSKNDGGNT